MHTHDEATGCWIWNGKTCANGRYGRLDNVHPMRMAHREAYIRAKGDIPKGMVVMHSCDVGLCVNPDHLSIGTHSDNMKDAARKRRIPLLLNQSGERNSNAKYSREFAEEVRRYYEENKPTFAALAERFCLRSKGHAHAIVTRKIWN